MKIESKHMQLLTSIIIKLHILLIYQKTINISSGLFKVFALILMIMDDMLTYKNNSKTNANIRNIK